MRFDLGTYRATPRDEELLAVIFANDVEIQAAAAEHEQQLHSLIEQVIWGVY